jgi:hypothetical protein
MGPASKNLHNNGSHGYNQDHSEAASMRSPIHPDRDPAYQFRIVKGLCRH